MYAIIIPNLPLRICYTGSNNMSFTGIYFADTNVLPNLADAIVFEVYLRAFAANKLIIRKTYEVGQISLKYAQEEGTSYLRLSIGDEDLYLEKVECDIIAFYIKSVISKAKFLDMGTRWDPNERSYPYSF